jgi:hypothetical protein
MSSRPHRRKDFRRPGGRYVLPVMAPAAAPPSGHQYRHAEAFCLMRYLADDGSEEEVVWNSRDGVTPFVITLRSGKSARHVNWHDDIRVRDHRPAPGTRMFVDLTRERALEQARRNAVGWWADDIAGCRSRWATEDDMVVQLADAYLETPGTPDLVEVPDAEPATTQALSLAVWRGRRGDGDVALGIAAARTAAEEEEAKRVSHDFVVQQTGDLRAGPIQSPEALVVVAMAPTDAPAGGTA